MLPQLLLLLLYFLATTDFKNAPPLLGFMRWNKSCFFLPTGTLYRTWFLRTLSHGSQHRQSRRHFFHQRALRLLLLLLRVFGHPCRQLRSSFLPRQVVFPGCWNVLTRRLRSVKQALLSTALLTRRVMRGNYQRVCCTSQP